MYQSNKLYYKIGEVCDIVGLKPSVLRFWEKEFRQLRPSKSSGGQRYYTEQHIAFLKTLKRMLHEEKYTIEGARKKLAAGASAQSESLPTPPVQAEQSRLSSDELKKELQAILDLMKA